MIIRTLRLLPLAIAAWALTACTGASTGQPSAGAAKGIGDRLYSFAMTNPKMVAAIVIALIGTVFIAFLWKNMAIRIVLALLIGGTVVYFAMGGGR